MVLLADNFALLWLGITATTLATTFLVGFSGEAAALEAAWKYLVLCSVGIALALLGIVVLAHVAIAEGTRPRSSADLDDHHGPRACRARRRSRGSPRRSCSSGSPPRQDSCRCTRGFPTHTPRRRRRSARSSPASSSRAHSTRSCARSPVGERARCGAYSCTRCCWCSARSTIVIAGMMMLNQSDLKRLRWRTRPSSTPVSSRWRSASADRSGIFAALVARRRARVREVRRLLRGWSRRSASGARSCSASLHDLWSSRQRRSDASRCDHGARRDAAVRAVRQRTAARRRRQSQPRQRGHRSASDSSGSALAFMALARATIEIEGGQPLPFVERPRLRPFRRRRRPRARRSRRHNPRSVVRARDGPRTSTIEWLPALAAATFAERVIAECATAVPLGAYACEDEVRYLFLAPSGPYALAYQRDAATVLESVSGTIPVLLVGRARNGRRTRRSFLRGSRRAAVSRRATA